MKTIKIETSLQEPKKCSECPCYDHNKLMSHEHRANSQPNHKYELISYADPKFQKEIIVTEEMLRAVLKLIYPMASEYHIQMAYIPLLKYTGHCVCPQPSIPK